MTDDIRRVMRVLLRDDVEKYRENLTALAEDAAHELDGDDWLDDPDHEVWELAIATTEEAGIDPANGAGRRP